MAEVGFNDVVSKFDMGGAVLDTLTPFHTNTGTPKTVVVAVIAGAQAETMSGAFVTEELIVGNSVMIISLPIKAASFSTFVFKSLMLMAEISTTLLVFTSKSIFTFDSKSRRDCGEFWRRRVRTPLT